MAPATVRGDDQKRRAAAANAHGDTTPDWSPALLPQSRRRG
jgi:hypothetical protein